MSLLLIKFLGAVSGWLPNLITLGASLVTKISGDSTLRYEAGAAASVPIIQASTTADLELNKLKLQESLSNSRWWVTAWEKPLLFYLCALHFGAIVLDSTFVFHWGVPKLPTPYDTYEGIIMLSDVLVLTTAGLTNKVISAIWK